jgi:hypothetical protein
MHLQMNKYKEDTESDTLYLVDNMFLLCIVFAECSFPGNNTLPDKSKELLSQLNNMNRLDTELG